MTEHPVALSVSEVTALVKNKLESDPALQDIWVRGEVSNFRQPASGHMYFTLKDDRSRLRAVMFRSKAQRLTFQIEDGLTLLVRGSISLYEASGDYQFYVEEAVPAGQGALYLAFEQLKARLEAEGLFAQKRELPFFPRHVGLITSATGAAVRDMISVIRRRNPTVNILLIPAIVQGEEAVPSLCQAIADAQKLNLDVLIIGRGGGSLEELWAFNEEAVARAIFASKIPTISAVGHETDFTIADFVADYRAPTPSAAAEVAVPELSALQAALKELQARGALALRKRVATYRERLRLLQSSPVLTQPDRLVREVRQRLDEAVMRAQTLANAVVERKRHQLGVVMARLDSLSPLATLERGYAICTHANTNEVVRDVAQVAHGDRVLVRVANGQFSARVTIRQETAKKLAESSFDQAQLPI